MAASKINLGQILVHDRVIDEVRLSDALRHQVVYGGRLGTNLIELGYASHDQIALGLAKKHSVPAALTRHLTNHDPELLDLFGRDYAARLIAFPVARLRTSTNQIAVCFRDPAPEFVAAASRVLGAKVVPSVAAELSVLYWLERCYALDRPQRYALSAPGGEAPLPRSTVEQPAANADDVDISFDDEEAVDVDMDEPKTLPDQFQLVDLDDVGVVKDDALYRPKRRTMSQLMDVARNSSNLDLAEAAQRAAQLAAEAVSGAATASMAAAEVADAEVGGANVGVEAKQQASRPEVLTLGQAVAAIAAADDRAKVADAVLGYMAGHFRGALMMIAKGDLALGYRGFGGNFDDDTVESIVVPLSVPSIFQSVQSNLQIFAGAPPKDSHAVQGRFFKLFPGGEPEYAAAIPVTVRGRLVCLFYGHEATTPSEAEEVLASLASLADATEKAFVRLIQAAKGS